MVEVPECDIGPVTSGAPITSILSAAPCWLFLGLSCLGCEMGPGSTQNGHKTAVLVRVSVVVTKHRDQKAS